MSALPTGFRELRRGRARLVVAEGRASAVAQLGLPGPLDEALAAGLEAAGPQGRGPVSVLPLPDSDQRLVVRKLLHGGLLGPWLGGLFLGLSRPIGELAVTARLRRAGAPVPEPVFAAGERRLGPLWHAAVATVYQEGTIDGQAFLESAPSEEALVAAAAAAGRAVRRFHDAGGRHGDLHVKNLLLRPTREGPRVLVIDLDRARMTPGLTPGERMSQIMRLFRSLVKRNLLGMVGRRGLARFFGAYCGDDRGLRRALLRRVDRELRKVALHALRYGR